MKKTLRIILALVICVSCMFSVTACNVGEDSNKTKLKVSYFKAGYGEKWIKDIAAAFEAENPTVKVVLEGNFDMENLIKTRFDSGDKNLLSDVYTICNPYYYMDYIRKGYLEDLSETFKQDVGDGETLETLVDPNMDALLKQNGKYYGVPWTGAATGIVYNVKMFKDNGWTVPETMDELVSLSYKIRAAGKVPVVYCGAAAEGYFLNPMIAWFAQYEGEAGIKEFYDFDSANVYKLEGKLKAYEQVAKIVADPQIVARASKSYNHLAAQREFIKGNAAMMPTGSWVETEMSEFLLDFPDFEMAMMPVPQVNADKTDKYGKPAKRFNAASADVFAIPKNARNVELAKEFLKFSSRQSMLEVFVKATGGNPRPLKIKKTEWTELNTMSQSIMEIWQNSFNIFPFSNAPIYIAGQVGPFLGNAGCPTTYISAGKSVSEGLDRAKTLFEDDFKIASQRFNDFKVK